MRRIFYCGLILVIFFGMFPLKAAIGETCHDNSIVTNSADSGPGSLRQAIVDVCAEGTVTFDTSLSGETITLTTGQLTIDKNLTIDGSGLTERVTVSGGGVSRVMWINHGKTVTVDRLVIANGYANAGENDSGGGIFNDGGFLTIRNSHILNNYAIWTGGGIANANETYHGEVTVINSLIEANSTDTSGGGGVFNMVNHTFTVKDSTFLNNTSYTGAALYNEGVMVVTGTTIKGNSATDHGGGMFNFGNASIANSTFTQNKAGFSGSGIFNFGVMTVYNTTLAGNIGFYTLMNMSPALLSIANSIIDAPDGSWGCVNDGGTISYSANNLFDVARECGSFSNADPLLNPLADNGGPTHTMALQGDSPAIDAGNDDVCSGGLTGGVDQRGAPRPYGAHCDIGAFEYGAKPPCSELITVTNANDSGPGSLRQAILDVCPGGTIDFESSLAGSTIRLSGGHIWVNKNLTIVGLGADELAISGNEVEHYGFSKGGDDVGGVFWVQGEYVGGQLQTIEVHISGLTIKDGRAREGGGIYNHSRSTLILTDCVIGPNNIVTEAGGGISNKFGAVTLNRCTVVENHGTGSLGGAGIFTAYGGEITLINSTVTGNVTNNFGGGILIWNDGTVNLIHSTVSGNLANQDYEDYAWGGGGGVYIQEGDVYQVGGTLNILNSIVAGNTDMSDPTTAGHAQWHDVYGEVTSQGGNLIGDGTGSSGWIVDDDLVGTASEPIDPLLDALGLNVPGSTPTFALLQGSPAIDAVACLEGVKVDQRGESRPQGFNCDIGAYEFPMDIFIYYHPLLLR